MLDQIDNKILLALQKNARTTYVEIAKECNVSTNTIRLRYQRLKETGIISKEIFQLNPKAFGYEIKAYLGINVEPGSEVCVLKYLKSMKAISMLTGRIQLGKYDIAGFVATKNIQDFSNVIQQAKNHTKIMSITTSFILTPSISVYFRGIPIPSIEEANGSYSYKNNENETLSDHHDFSSDPNNSLDDVDSDFASTLDELDLKIINRLTNNARISFKKVAEQLDVSPLTVINRYEKLRRTVFDNSTISINLKKIGYQGWFGYLVKTKPGQDSMKILHEILCRFNPAFILRSSGEYDIIAYFLFSDFFNLTNLKNELSRISGTKEADCQIGMVQTEWPPNTYSAILSPESTDFFKEHRI